MDDDTYSFLFSPIIDSIMDNYKPNAVVFQSGADSISGDRLGCFNLSVKGHGACIEHVKKYRLPMLVLGGGGYTLRNVARAWTYETGLLVGQDITNGTLFSDSSRDTRERLSRVLLSRIQNPYADQQHGEQKHAAGAREKPQRHP